MKKSLYVSFFAFLTCLPLMKAQMTPSGTEPTRTGWRCISGPTYKVIYPESTDSLAKAYARTLEYYSIPVSRSIGFIPNQSYRRPMPVVLHPFSATSNGSVTWTPRRMELYTTPDPYAPDPLPWMDNLAIHESRHVAQMQFVNHRGRKFWQVLTGELAAGAFAAIYPGPAFLEGDAVAAETALTMSGRGRSADFLEYMAVSFDNGDWRNWYKWRYGSLRHYTPDYYRAGYILFAGMRTLYDEPLFTEKYFDRLFRHKVFNMPFFNLQHTVRSISGKNFRNTFLDIEHYFHDIWTAEAQARAPFMPSCPVTPVPRRFESLEGSTLAGEEIYSIREGISLPASVVRADGKSLTAFAHTTSSLMWSEPLQLFFWSESIPDPRWEMLSTSRIRHMEADGKRKRDLTKEGLYFNPSPSPSDGRIAAVRYEPDGRTAVVELDGRSGEELCRYCSTDGLQVVEAAWQGESIIVSAISRAGFGLYEATAGYKTILEPQPVKIKQLRSSNEGAVHFVSDRTGVCELYSLENGALFQLTNTRYGASDFVFKGDSLYYSSLSAEGRTICRTAIADLPAREVNFADIHHYPVADELSAQEKTLASGHGNDSCFTDAPYRKAAHLLHVHSWAPVFFNYDNMQKLSFDTWYQTAGVGATVLFQNTLSTFYGSAGYSFHPDPMFKDAAWRHSGHLHLTWRGLYPVFEVKMDLGDRNSMHYHFTQTKDGGRKLTRSMTGSPCFSGTAVSYVPFNFSSGGWSRGLIPQISYAWSNDDFKSTFIRQAEVALRAYSVRPTAPSGVYPRLGAGVELSYSFSKRVVPSLGVYAYGYLPGIVPEHGIRLTANFRRIFPSGEVLAMENSGTLPRGLTHVSNLYGTLPEQLKLTADYKMAFAPVDWSFLGPVAYIRNFELSAFFDGALYNSGSYGTYSLFSTGAELVARLENLLWIPYTTRIGVSYSYNGGSGFNLLSSAYGADRNHFSLIFSIDF